MYIHEKQVQFDLHYFMHFKISGSKMVAFKIIRRWMKGRYFLTVSLLRAEFTSVKLWPVLGCWPGSTPGSGCCVPGCGSGGMESPAGRWCTACCIHQERRRGWAGAGAASGTDPKFPKNSLLLHSPALSQLYPQDFTTTVSAWTFFFFKIASTILWLVWKWQLGQKIIVDVEKIRRTLIYMSKC